MKEMNPGVRTGHAAILGTLPGATRRCAASDCKELPSIAPESSLPPFARQSESRF